MIYFILAHISFLIVGFLFWYVMFGLTCYMNGSISMWKTFKEDCLFAIPFLGSKYKAKYIKDMLDKWPSDRGSFVSSRGSWDYSEVREHNLYEKVGNAMLPGTLSFVFQHVIIPLSPLALLYLAFGFISLW